MESFTYSVSHDLKSPLVTIESFLGLIERDIGEGKLDRVQGDMDKIHSATRKMSRLLDELLQLSRVGRLENVPAPEIAIDYWGLAPDARLRDVVLSVRADEAGHRDKNHEMADQLAAWPIEPKRRRLFPSCPQWRAP